MEGRELLKGASHHYGLLPLDVVIAIININRIITMMGIVMMWAWLLRFGLARAMTC